MGLDGAPREVKRARNLGARMTERDQAQDLRLSRAQVIAADCAAQRIEA